MTSSYYLETTHHLATRANGFDLDLILDSVELATQARAFTNTRGEEQTYLLVTLDFDTWGVGYRLQGTTLVCTTLLTPTMVQANELGKGVSNLKELTCLT